MTRTKIKLGASGLNFSATLYGDKSDFPLVMCLHGFPDGPQTFRHQIDDFVTAGFQVLTVTMRGYEPSSIPENKDFAVTSMAEDVLTWIEQLQVSKVHLVGHDWGSAIAYYTAFLKPEVFASLTTIAIPHPQRFVRRGLLKVPSQNLKSWYMLFNQIPFLSDFVARRNNFAYLKFLWRKWSPGYSLASQDWLDLQSQFSEPGVLKSTLYYYRQNVSPLQLLSIKNSVLNKPFKIDVPNLAITGEHDGCVDTRIFEHSVLEQDHLRGMRIERIKGAGHFVHQEKPELVNKMMIKWFQNNQ